MAAGTFKYMFKHTCIVAVKTITITEEAYNTIRGLKEEHESFSNLFVRLGKRSLTCKDIIGILKQTPEEARELAHRVHVVHERLGQGLGRRAADVRARLQRTH